MFAAMRNVLGIKKPTDILGHIQSLPYTLPPRDPATNQPSTPTPLNHRPTAQAAIKAIESSTMTSQTPQPGLRDLMLYLERRGVKKSLCTRNFLGPVNHLRKKFLQAEDGDIHFHPVITRETVGIEPKPSPMGIWKCALEWAAEASAFNEQPTIAMDTVATKGKDKTFHNGNNSNSGISTDIAHEQLLRLANPLIMVGDTMDDMAAGHRAGAATILLASPDTDPDLFRPIDASPTTSVLNSSNGEFEDHNQATVEVEGHQPRERKPQEQGQHYQHDYVDRVVWSLDEIIDLLEDGFESWHRIRED